ncbi:MAG: rubredoxin [Spirochaetes bacterium]|nr:rubredoxin [Spirochaetota bacterium]
MKKYMCDLCGYEYSLYYLYDEEASGVKFEDLPADWICPLCGAGKEAFSEFNPEKPSG